MENYRGLNGTIVIDALRSDQIVDMYLRQRRKLVLDWMLELLNPTSCSNLTALLSVRLLTSWSSLSPSILSALKASNALPFFFISRVQVYSQSRALILAVLYPEILFPRALHGWPIFTSRCAQLSPAQRSYSWTYYIKHTTLGTHDFSTDLYFIHNLSL